MPTWSSGYDISLSHEKNQGSSSHHLLSDTVGRFLNASGENAKKMKREPTNVHLHAERI